MRSAKSPAPRVEIARRTASRSCLNMASKLSADAAEFVSGRQAMFEDSIFESAGRIHTRSHEWMIAAFAFNATILMAFAMIPLIFPPALPQRVSAFLMEVFVPPKPQPLPQQPAQTARSTTVMASDH